MPKIILENAECRRIDAFKLWCWRRHLRAPSTSGRSNQSILKEINPKYPLEGLMLKLKLQSFGHLMWRVNSLEKALILEKIEGRRRRGRWRMRTLHGITDSIKQAPGDREGQGSRVCSHSWSGKESDMTELDSTIKYLDFSSACLSTYILCLCF